MEQNRWEAAGFGKAPFSCIGMFTMPNKETATMSDYAALPRGAGSCAICGTGLHYNYIVRDAEGKTFIAGCDCINRMGDTVTMKEAKTARRAQRDAVAIAARKAEREAREAQRAIDRAELIKTHGDLFDRADALKLEWVDSIIASCTTWGNISDKQKAALENAITRAEEEAARTNEFFGEVGKRITRELKVDRWITIFHGDYFRASQYLVLMRDEDGRTFVYKGAGACLPRAGDTVKMKMTITAHEDYNGVKQTFIARPALVA